MPAPINNEVNLATFLETLAILKVTPGWLRYKVHRREIPFLKVGRHIRFDLNELKKWLAETASRPVKSSGGQNE